MKHILSTIIFSLTMSTLLSDEMRIPYGDPTNVEQWKTYRKTVIHPCVSFKTEDLIRAKKNIENHDWARNYANNLSKNADKIAEQMTKEFLDMMVEITTAGGTTPCPACRDKGLRWLPNNNWQWSVSTPNQIRCPHCGTVYPNDKYPETIKVQSKWDPRQVFTFIDVEPFPCFGYKQSMSNPSGIIRASKVGYVFKQLDTLSTSYALNGKIEHAEAIKRILLKIAEVLPHYLVRVGYTYNEYADCDPHIACMKINDLPTDEIVAPPNKPDRSLWTGYWSASRFHTQGMDGGTAVTFANAYDITYNATYPDGRPLYTEEERLIIEKDVLLESALLACGDTKINNKSVGNRAGAAAVGMALGMPDLIRFGLDGFVKTVEDWFLPDGTTSESAGYGLMTMGGIHSFPYIFRDYTEPEDYIPPQGSARLQHFDACRDTNYGTCWQSFAWTLQGNLFYPPLADSRKTTSLGGTYTELIALAYPTDENISLLHAIAGKKPNGTQRAAIFNRGTLQDAKNIGMMDNDNTVTKPIFNRNEDEKAKPFVCHDIVFPFLAQGMFRLGTYGRDGLALIDASNWGNHHHYDSLNLYLWKDGHELLGDLGYLWDHPDKKMTMRTLAHNLVTIDDKEQISRDRGGSFHYFAVSPHVKAMRASSNAYTKKSIYERSLVQVSHGKHGAYWLDMFKAKGGSFRDYLFHGPNNEYTVENLTFGKPKLQKPLNVPFVLKISSRALAVMDFKDVRIVKDNGEKGGRNMAKPIPIVLKKGEKNGYDLYIGNGKATLEAITNEEEPFLRYTVTAPDGKGTFNTGFVIGDSNGYVGHDAFIGQNTNSYRITLKMRSKAPAFFASAVLWYDDDRSEDARQSRALRVLNPPKLDGSWEEVTMILEMDNQSILPPQEIADGKAPWSMTWKMDENYRFTVFSPGHEGETVRISQDWGQRDSRNKDRGTLLPYVRRHRVGHQLDTFITAFCGYNADKELVKSIRTEELKNGACVAYVETVCGTDVILFGECNDVTLPELQTDARLAVLTSNGDRPKTAFMLEGTKLIAGRMKLSLNAPSYSGKIVTTADEKGSSWFELDTAIPEGAWDGQTILVCDDSGLQRAYPIRHVENVQGKTRIYTKYNYIGIIARPAETWLLQTVASIH
ncbi:MAG: heparinase II/III family protein [Victivallales bacterium]|nr:heparinase II/III family protein [Victivallales bacterium]